MIDCGNYDCEYYDIGSCLMEDYPQFECPEKEEIVIIQERLK